VKLIIKKLPIIVLIFSFSFLSIPHNSSTSEKFIEDYGIIVLMYHRFEENKYPSTNTKIANFKNQLNLIKEEKIKFINPYQFNQNLIDQTNLRKVMITIDDAFSSFYENAWPIIKDRKIPIILFVSTREVGKKGYMTWEQIREISKENFVHIGNHSHTHEYLIDYSLNQIKEDLLKSISTFKKEIGYNSNFFSYPFGEYSLEFKNLVRELGFTYAFGQHSGVIDLTKDKFELPRFPINEKYGEIKRFKTLLKTLPFKYKKIIPEEKYINDKTNPPNIIVEFEKMNSNLKNINCFSNEEGQWRNSKIIFLNDFTINIKLQGKFTTERGRVNCSLRDVEGFYRWFGIQFVVAEK
tara:strand:+ start:847 stop:1902 length:1056 start_codon:yes stop_codon:yes gene_type:complete